jgi:hypothetical protein
VILKDSGFLKEQIATARKALDEAIEGELRLDNALFFQVMSAVYAAQYSIQNGPNIADHIVASRILAFISVGAYTDAAHLLAQSALKSFDLQMEFWDDTGQYGVQIIFDGRESVGVGTGFGMAFLDALLAIVEEQVK